MFFVYILAATNTLSHVNTRKCLRDAWFWFPFGKLYELPFAKSQVRLQFRFFFFLPVFVSHWNWVRVVAVERWKIKGLERKICQKLGDAYSNHKRLCERKLQNSINLNRQVVLKKMPLGNTNGAMRHTHTHTVKSRIVLVLFFLVVIVVMVPNVRHTVWKNDTKLIGSASRIAL